MRLTRCGVPGIFYKRDRLFPNTCPFLRARSSMSASSSLSLVLVVRGNDRSGCEIAVNFLTTIGSILVRSVRNFGLSTLRCSVNLCSLLAHAFSIFFGPHDHGGVRLNQFTVLLANSYSHVGNQQPGPKLHAWPWVSASATSARWRLGIL